MPEISHTEKDKYHMVSLIYGTGKKSRTKEQTKQKETQKQTPKEWLPEGRGVKKGEGKYSQ